MGPRTTQSTRKVTPKARQRKTAVVEVAMEDIELVRVAAFKLQDSANRLQTLARAARSPRVRARLLALARQLARHETDLLGVAIPK